MSNDLNTPTATAHGRRGPALTRTNKIGLGLSAVLGLADLVGLLLTPEPAAGEEGPPFVVLVAGTILGLLTLIAVVYTWRTGNRVGARVVAGTRILSAISALPAFFVGGVGAPLVATAAALVVLTIIAVGLVLARPARTT